VPARVRSLIFEGRGRLDRCRTPKMCPQGHVSGIQGEREGREHAEHQKHGVSGVPHKGEGVGMRRTPKPTRACFGVREEEEGEQMRRTSKTCPFGACFWCLRRGEEEGEGKKRGTRRTPKHAQQGRVLVSGTRGRDGDTLDTRACFGVRDEGKKRGTCPTRRKGWGRFEHQNAPYKGTFWCLACWERARLGRERFVGEKGGGEARLRLCWVEVSKRKLIKNSERTLYTHPTPPSVSPGPPMWSIIGGSAFVANEGDGG